MPDLERRLLAGHKSRALGTLPGCAAVGVTLIGLPFLAAGLFLSFLPAKTFTTSGGSTGEAPAWLSWMIAALFGVPGLLVSAYGVLALLRGARLRRSYRRSEPWLTEHPWREDGSRDDSQGGLPGQLGALLFLLVFLAPFNYFAFVVPSGDMPVWAMGLVAFFDLMPLLVLWGVVYGLLARLRQGRSFLAFERFPFFLGERFEGRFRSARDLAAFQGLGFTLRCVEEVAGDNRRGSRAYQVYADERTVNPQGSPDPREVGVSFTLPRGDYSTRIAKEPNRYWELTVRGEAPGNRLNAVFLVPVYERTS